METGISLLPVTGCICLLISVITGWVLALIRYLKINSLIRLFPGYHYLVRSHVDYIIMGVLLFAIYAVLSALDIFISKSVIAALITGALYNPAGFIFQAVTPEIAEGDSIGIKIGILAGFVPISFGLLGVFFAIISKFL